MTEPKASGSHEPARFFLLFYGKRVPAFVVLEVRLVGNSQVAENNVEGTVEAGGIAIELVMDLTTFDCWFRKYPCGCRRPRLPRFFLIHILAKVLIYLAAEKLNGVHVFGPTLIVLNNSIGLGPFCLTKF
ncbi:uncharacterized protein J3R85_017804 [Psidium guajava]|nr:uncharacterized protein J3R85_017804 [Psidium guajava]